MLSKEHSLETMKCVFTSWLNESLMWEIYKSVLVTQITFHLQCTVLKHKSVFLYEIGIYVKNAGTSVKS